MLPLQEGGVSRFPRGIEWRVVSLEIRKGFGPGCNVARDVPGDHDGSVRRETLQTIHSLVYTVQPAFMPNPVILQVRRRGEV